ncbi:hypothetical protein [Pseudomonas putida]|uniref:hypothetical protein n=1 Tax=Pseudomonas putida TaxID=303 RepID=UPI0008190767|nr:hypothetical protein [Pseudomonas putida]OCT25690.1 hypothetical protein A6E24_11325 [Pseudomonas putida]OCT27613.1 hypothetical protein A6E23_07760 [Pseudomonas putida]OCT32112.1 hypothetical protein A6E20_00550 [Pseudomonas putida]OCT39016.1 hypothetical protein A6E19_11945 [Pseudomonas putida]
MNDIATPYNDALPSMIGFAEERIGIPRCEWTSPCYLLADRDLALGEVIRVWAVDRRDGRVLKVVALEATAANCTQDKWPAALIKAIRDDKTQFNDSKLLHAGVIKGDTFKTGKASHSTADCIAASSHEDYNRLWVFSTYARLFTNAPFAANQVIAHNLVNMDFERTQRMCVQVRDRVSQGLLESIVVTFEANTTSAARAKALCEAVMQNSQILRAGVLADDGISITLNDQGNALWIPQFSELSVTVAPAAWVLYDTFSASRALTVDEELRVHIHDDVTGIQLTGSPFIFKASDKALGQSEWPAALAEKLQTSPLRDYLALELDKNNGTPSGQWNCAGVPLRILMSAPLEENNDWVPMLSEDSQPDQAVTIYQQLLQLTESKKKADVDAVETGYFAPLKYFRITGNIIQPDKNFKVISVEVTLQDVRTGYICHRSSLDFTVDYPNTTQIFTEALIDSMRRGGIPEVASKHIPSSSHNAATPEERLTLWLPKRLGMRGTLRLSPPTELWRPEVGSLLLTFPYTPILDEFEYYTNATLRGHIIRNRSPGMLANRKAAENVKKTLFRSLLLGNTAIIPNRFLQLKIKPEAISTGVRFLALQKDWGETLLLSLPARSLPLALVGVTGAYFNTKSPWYNPFELELEPPVDPIESFFPDSTLCADNCMTLGAHVYDTGGARDTGVDENTGLFHAHYPVASLKGLGGIGPELDLTLHYSAIRANEGALGDGWAFRFSYFDNRRRVLTLSSGHTLTLTKAQMKLLSADKTKFLDQDGYRITAVEGNEDAWNALTIQMPPGLDARQEVLQLPVTHDGEEAGTEFKTRYKNKLNEIIANLTRWIDKEKITSDQIADLKKQRETWKKELADIDRQSLILVTSSIRSAQGGELKLAWQGIKGHIRLDSIKDGSTVLLRANHGPIELVGLSQSTFTVWPDTPEGYEVTLDIRNCLLESIKRHPIGQINILERHVRFNYHDDPALDLVLTSIIEEDGSLEAVVYENSKNDSNFAPRVKTHVLVPGSGQDRITHHYLWKGDYAVEQLDKWQRGSSLTDTTPFVRTTWTFNGGVRVVDSIIEEHPGVSRRTTRFTYPAKAQANDYKYLTLSRPIKIEVTTESLATAPTEEDES